MIETNRDRGKEGAMEVEAWVSVCVCACVCVYVCVCACVCVNVRVRVWGADVGVGVWMRMSKQQTAKTDRRTETRSQVRVTDSHTRKCS